MNIVIISTSHSEFSRSRELALEARSVLLGEGCKVDLVDMRVFPPVWVDDRDIGDYPSMFQDLASVIAVASGVIIAHPVYNYSASSGVKLVTEIVGDVLEDKPVALLVGAGGSKSHLAVGAFMTSMMFEQNTIVFPKYVMASKEDCFIDSGLTDDLRARVAEVAKEFAGFCDAVTFWRSRTSVLSQTYPEDTFMELYVEDLEQSRLLFCAGLGFRLIRSEDGFVELRKGFSTLLLNSGADDIQRHPFRRAGGKERGVGCEIVVVVTDIEAAYSAVGGFADVRMQAGLTVQDWGMTDFRFFTREGFYIRVSTPRVV